MSVPVSPTQQQRLEKGEITPVVLIDLEAQGKTLRFCTDAAVTVSGNLYQPFLRDVGTLLTQGSFPENNTQVKEYQLEFLNTATQFEGTALVITFDQSAFSEPCASQA